MKANIHAVCIAALIGGALAEPVGATEFGGSIYPVGTENYTCCALPPPGIYGMLFVEQYHATKIKNNAGNDVAPPDFKVNATAVAPRFVWITGEQILGASLGFHAILPIVSLEVTVPGLRQRKTGIGDVVTGPVLGWHLSPMLHTVLAVDVFAPTGKFDRNDLAHLGRNYVAVQPLTGVSYMDPSGLNADAKVMYTFNMKNKDTRYTSGDEFIVDYDAGWGLGNGWVVGVGGYLYHQTTDDKQAGATVANNRGRTLAIGPSIRYDSGKGWFATLKYEKETGVRNRAAGEALWLKAVVPF